MDTARVIGHMMMSLKMACQSSTVTLTVLPSVVTEAVFLICAGRAIHARAAAAGNARSPRVDQHIDGTSRSNRHTGVP